jgi:hypothetical protein
MTLLLLFNNRSAAAALSVTETDDSLTAIEATLVSPSAAITEADDSISSTSAVLVSPSASLTEADDAASGTSTVLISLSASINETDDAISAAALSGGSSVSASNSGAGGYVRVSRVRDARAKPKQPERLTAVAVLEHGDSVSAAATVAGQSLAETEAAEAAAALELAEAEAAKKRSVIDHNNRFLMAA